MLAASRLFALLALLVLQPAQQPPTPVRTAEVERREVQQRQDLTGNLRAKQRATVAAVEPARVTEVLFDEAERVEAGQILIRQDDRRLRQAKVAAEADVAVAKADLAEREADLERLRLDYESQQAAADQMPGSVSELDVRASRTAVSTSEARVEAARQRVDAAGAAIEEIQVRLEDLTIAAPFDGTVVRRMVEVGEWAGAGGAVAEMVSDGVFEAVIDVPERFDFASLRDAAAGAVTVTVDTHDLQLTPDRLRAVPSVDPRSRRYQIVADVRSDDPVRPLAAGMSVTATVPTSTRAEHLVLPYDALLQNAVGDYVYVVAPPRGESPATAVPTNVDVLFRFGTEVAVASPQLQPGATVVVEGGERLMPMTPVDPTPAEDPRQAPGDGGQADLQADLSEDAQ